MVIKDRTQLQKQKQPLFPAWSRIHSGSSVFHYSIQIIFFACGSERLISWIADSAGRHFNSSYLSAPAWTRPYLFTSLLLHLKAFLENLRPLVLRWNKSQQLQSISFRELGEHESPCSSVMNATWLIWMVALFTITSFLRTLLLHIWGVQEKVGWHKYWMWRQNFLDKQKNSAWMSLALDLHQWDKALCFFPGLNSWSNGLDLRHICLLWIKTAFFVQWTQTDSGAVPVFSTQSGSYGHFMNSTGHLKRKLAHVRLSLKWPNRQQQ